MTRTERNIYPAALAKDRSVSKSGLDKSLRKNGAGPHNWGSFEEQTHPYIHHNLDNAKLPLQNQNFRGDEEDIDLDNADDAQNDQMATSPSTAAAINVDGGGEQAEKGVPNGGMQRRMSNMTDEEREKAKAWRHGAMNRDSLDLASIARTSGAFSHSPPNADAILSTSPVMNMSAMAGKLNKY
ncbi:hypothetical protein QFC21_002397 [Naganishia friedmannii]|uniref:Uncharacterized protein n=1 Tax=Naganishia friedmannii TaxID=89922 RepID=A0ACC2VY69_9TREE|nr:hypothetical protein QFC21_002397 [Naganishia friedmannii]